MISNLKSHSDPGTPRSHACNLQCDSYSHFANHGSAEWADWKKAAAWISHATRCDYRVEFLSLTQ